MRLLGRLAAPSRSSLALSSTARLPSWRALVLLAVACAALAIYLVPTCYQVNALLALLPPAAHAAFSTPNGGAFIWHARPPVMARLAGAPWPGSWALPTLRPPADAAVAPSNASSALGQPAAGSAPPVLLMLHIFSRSTARAAERRQLLRAYSPLATIPRGYRHLVEVKFVLGRPAHDVPPAARARLDAAVDDEMRTYGDVVRLEHLEHGDNMNEGKSVAWLEHVGRAGGREAWWVVKCDDDTLPLLPNLLPYLLEHDPQVPTYFGNPLCSDAEHFYYQHGMMYGMSWGIVSGSSVLPGGLVRIDEQAKTIAAANLTREDRLTWEEEDARVGRLMVSLPAQPQSASRSHAAARHAHCAPGTSRVPAAARSAPDERTGLVRLRLSRYIGDHALPWTRGWQDAMAWHRLKGDDAWLAAWDEAVDGFASVGRRFMWDPPASMRYLEAA